MKKTIGALLGMGLVGLMLAVISTPAAARVSLTEIDAKLDQLLAGQGGGFDIDNHVQLRLIFSFIGAPCPQNAGYHRVSPSGALASQSFVVPRGKVLLVTDIQWSSVELPQAGFSAGRVLRMRLRSQLADGTDSRLVFISAPVEITAANNAGKLGTSETLRAGLAVGAGREICPSTLAEGLIGSSVHTPSTSFLRGILVDE